MGLRYTRWWADLTQKKQTHSRYSNYAEDLLNQRGKRDALLTCEKGLFHIFRSVQQQHAATIEQRHKRARTATTWTAMMMMMMTIELIRAPLLQQTFLPPIMAAMLIQLINCFEKREREKGCHGARNRKRKCVSGCVQNFSKSKQTLTRAVCLTVLKVLALFSVDVRRMLAFKVSLGLASYCTKWSWIEYLKISQRLKRSWLCSSCLPSFTGTAVRHHLQELQLFLLLISGLQNMSLSS